MARPLATLLALALLLACGRTQPPGDEQDLARLQASDGGVECVENGDCGSEDVCLQNACVFFGECLRDWHCYTTGGCVDNQCLGDPPPYEETDPQACQINADCPDRFYCVSGGCWLGVECLVHAHCDVGKACVGRICVDAL
jgi:hypothetical protein